VMTYKYVTLIEVPWMVCRHNLLFSSLFVSWLYLCICLTIILHGWFLLVFELVPVFKVVCSSLPFVFYLTKQSNKKSSWLNLLAFSQQEQYSQYIISGYSARAFNFFLAKTQKALCFDALIEKREFLHMYKLKRANTASYNSTH
jgi:predicted membrane metal-binding protein